MRRTGQKRKKEKQFKAAKQRRFLAARERGSSLRSLETLASDRGLELVSFDITHDAMPDPALDALPASDIAEIERIGQALHSDAASVKAPLEKLVAKFPHIPCLWNWLMLSVGRAGDPDRALRMAEEIYLRFPNYLFGVAQWVMNLLNDGRIDEATKLLDGRLGLKQWWPDRRRYHATEFVTFNGMLGCYFVATGNLKAADVQLEMIADILPDHPAVHVLDLWLSGETILMSMGEHRAERLAPLDPRPAHALKLAGGAKRLQS